MTKYNVFSGGFDPITPGHVSVIESQFRNDKRETIIILNRDDWLLRKKGAVFMPFDERKYILESIKGVNRVITQIDDDDTVCKTLRFLCENSPNDQFVFVNAGDKKTENIPEYKLVRNMSNLTYNTLMSEYQKAHSSTYLADWVNKNSIDHILTSTTQRPWGYWKVLDQFQDHHRIWHKIKLLVVTPGQSLSTQRHFSREETWKILEGTGKLVREDIPYELYVDDQVVIPVSIWHQLSNPSSSQRLVVLEVQRATVKDVQCTEEDIERKV